MKVYPASVNRFSITIYDRHIIFVRTCKTQFSVSITTFDYMLYYDFHVSNSLFLRLCA